VSAPYPDSRLDVFTQHCEAFSSGKPLDRG
jgi:hypothetical protein